MCENPDPTPELKDWQPNGRLIGDETGAQTHGPRRRRIVEWDGAAMVSVPVDDESIEGM